MSLYNPNKQKKFFYPKEPLQKNKSYDCSSKSTRATSKNIFAMKNQKLFEKVEYHDLYSDLVSTRQSFQYTMQKGFQKEENEESHNNSFSHLDKFVFKKNKKPYSQKKVKIDIIKYFKEDGDAVNFPLYKENEIKIDIYDDQVKIESAEDDFDSDEGTLEYGKQKVEKDLIEAFAAIRKDKINCFVNYNKFKKFIKKPKRRMDLLKNLPYVTI